MIRVVSVSHPLAALSPPPAPALTAGHPLQPFPLSSSEATTKASSSLRPRCFSTSCILSGWTSPSTPGPPSFLSFPSQEQGYSLHLLGNLVPLIFLSSECSPLGGLFPLAVMESSGFSSTFLVHSLGWQPLNKKVVPGSFSNSLLHHPLFFLECPHIHLIVRVQWGQRTASVILTKRHEYTDLLTR